MLLQREIFAKQAKLHQMKLTPEELQEKSNIIEACACMMSEFHEVNVAAVRTYISRILNELRKEPIKRSKDDKDDLGDEKKKARVQDKDEEEGEESNITRNGSNICIM